MDSEAEEKFDARKIKGFDFNQLGKVLVNAKIYDGLPYRGMGKKCSVNLKVKTQPIGLEFFVENIIPPQPSHIDLGYRPTDITTFKGVIVCEVHREPDDDHTKEFTGEAIPFEEFIDLYITDKSAVFVMEHLMNKMSEQASLDDEFLSKMDSLWKDRKINTKLIYKTVIC